MVPAVRGDIHDRAGRPLALSVATWRVGVAPSLLRDPARVAGVLAEVLGRDEAQLRRRLAATGDLPAGLDEGRHPLQGHHRLDQTGRPRRSLAVSYIPLDASQPGAGSGRRVVQQLKEGA